MKKWMEMSYNWYTKSAQNTVPDFSDVIKYEETRYERKQRSKALKLEKLEIDQKDGEK